MKLKQVPRAQEMDLFHLKKKRDFSRIIVAFSFITRFSFESSLKDSNG